MQAFCSISLRVITGPAITTIFLVPATAQAHWGHLGELAGHGHWIAAADEAVPEEAETNGEQSHA